MPRQISSARITTAILEFFAARERAGSCRSSSAGLAAAASLGCRVSGGAAPEPPQMRLLAAERPLALCTDLEVAVLRERYWHSDVIAIVRQWGNRREEYLRPAWRSPAEVARRLEAPSAEAVKTRIKRARVKIRAMLERVES